MKWPLAKPICAALMGGIIYVLVLAILGLLVIKNVLYYQA